MRKSELNSFIKFAAYSMLISGILLVAFAVIQALLVPAVLGAELLCWSVILFYVKPAQERPLNELVTNSNEMQVPNTSRGKSLQTKLRQQKKLDYLELEIGPRALSYFKAKGEVFVLTPIQNLPFLYSKIKGRGSNLKIDIEFQEFVELNKLPPNLYNDSNDLGKKYEVCVYTSSFPAVTRASNLEFYVSRSGFSSVHEWIDNQCYEEATENDSKRTYCLYHLVTFKLKDSIGNFERLY